MKERWVGVEGAAVHEVGEGAWSATRLADALVELLEEPFATPEDVALDVRRVERTGPGRVPTVEVDLADGSRFRFAVERVP